MKMQKKDLWKVTKKERERLKAGYIGANEQFEREMNQCVKGNRKLSWKKEM